MPIDTTRIPAELSGKGTFTNRLKAGQVVCLGEGEQLTQEGKKKKLWLPTHRLFIESVVPMPVGWEAELLASVRAVIAADRKSPTASGKAVDVETARGTGRVYKRIDTTHNP